MTIVGQDRKLADDCFNHLQRLLEERENFDKLLKYAEKYQISIQFWGEGNTNVFIMKDDADLWDGGGWESAEAIEKAVEYLDRINRINTKPLEATK